MTRAARWIRLSPAATPAWRATCAGLAELQSARAAPILLWAQGKTHHAFALIAPKLLAPGRPSRWCAWALSPAVATYRHFGLPAYLEQQNIWLHGSKIASGDAASIGECAVVASSFLPRFPGDRPPSGRELEDAFRVRIEAQHDWQFETAWPSEAEAAAIEGARLEPAESFEADLLRRAG